MKRLFVAALLAGAAIAHAQTAASAGAASAAKKELVQRVLVLQQSGIESMARNLIEQPAARMMQGAGQALQQVAPEKREAVGKAVEADIKKFVDDATPILRDRAVKLAPSTIGATLEEKFSEDELKQLIAWLESPVNKKYAQLGPDMQSNFSQKLIADVRPLIEPRLHALEAKVRASLGLPVAAVAASAAAAASAAPIKAPAPKKAASK